MLFILSISFMLFVLSILSSSAPQAHTIIQLYGALILAQSWLVIHSLSSTPLRKERDTNGAGDPISLLPNESDGTTSGAGDPFSLLPIRAMEACW